MAANLLEFDSKDGSAKILIEMDEVERPRGVAPVAARGTTQKAAKRFEDSLDTVKTVANAVVSKLNSAELRPNEVKVEFGLKLNAAADAFITKVGGEAHFTLSLTWKNG